MTMKVNYERCSLKCCDSASCPSCHSSALLGGLGGQARRQASIQICPRPISTQNPATGLAEPDHGGKCWTLIGRGRLSWDEARVGYRKWKHPAADSNSGRAAEFGKCFRCIDEKHSKTFVQWECGWALLFGITSKHSFTLICYRQITPHFLPFFHLFSL